MTEPLTTTLGVRPSRAAPRPGTIERIPKWLNLVPMVLQWCWLGLRHGSLTLPSAVNPQITAGGLVGDTKSEYFAGMGAHARSRVAPYVMLGVEGGDMLAAALSAMNEAGLAFPVVAKPDLGWCGFGVRRLDDAPELADYLRQYPAGESLMLQRYLDEPGEAGIFYVRHPDQPRGWLLGILLRHYPQVVGDGVRNVAQLIRADARLQRAMRNQREHECQYDPDEVPAPGDTVRLSLIGSTRVGGRYEDGSALASEALLAAIEAIARDMPQFHAGRFDVRYRTLQDLRCGRFTIMEVNGAGSEAVHAWDPKYSVWQVYRMVFAKQRLLFAMGAANRARGHRPIGMLALARHHLHQQRLIRRYPPSN
ncbi:hypothetical protein EAH75_11675 [Rhodanobacter glycinis]|uniref:ATP-grasp domain-containing protein n=1 Tax=Rhodanobacter glycinis TaxID=582702 RepID=A0A502CHW1_9GAMM|nr:hypothetical protein [Rhodanobacter glycinis]TPG11649.1 hypothetical protein EAH88_03860 [Rhodanobacter glycinis]TPG47499.1 hypothetical protein EAH75_11675 [Rhodanobacter glycinis]